MEEAELERGCRSGASELPLQASGTHTRYGSPVFHLLELVFRTEAEGQEAGLQGACTAPRFRFGV